MDGITIMDGVMDTTMYMEETQYTVEGYKLIAIYQILIEG
jgi:hypothetical protein